MASPTLRFIHASDFHLERPLRGLGEVPPGLSELMVDAPLRAATRVFDAALAEQVDFVLLAGDILRPTAAGPRGLVLLVEQLERLHARDIPVYWTTGRADAATRWTDILHLPPNVHLAASRRVEHWKFEREGRLRAEIMGRARPTNNTSSSRLASARPPVRWPLPWPTAGWPHRWSQLKEFIIGLWVVAIAAASSALGARGRPLSGHATGALAWRIGTSRLHAGSG